MALQLASAEDEKEEGINSGDVHAEVEESPVTRTRAAPHQPTKEEILQHEASHEPFRSWCAACVSGRGRVFKHVMPDHSADSLSVIAVDYGYLSGKFVDNEEVEEEGSTPLLCG